MAQFDVYAFPAGSAPYVVQVQADILDGLNTRVVVPLLPLAPRIQISRLHPSIDINGQSYFLATNLTATVMAADLASPVLSLAETHRQAIIDAMDFLLVGI